MKLSKLAIGWLLVIVLTTIALLFALSPRSDAGRVTAISGIVVAAATLILALVTAASIEESRRQTQFTQRAQNRPLLVPTSAPDQAHFPNEGPFDISFRNVGHGVAQNIWGVLMPAVPEITSVPIQYSIRYSLPLAAGENVSLHFSQIGTIFTHADNIQGFTLGVPKELAPEEGIPNSGDRRDRIIAKLTITYSDIFGIFHASVYDYTRTAQWLSVVSLDEVAEDLGKIDKKKSII